MTPGKGEAAHMEGSVVRGTRAGRGCRPWTNRRRIPIRNVPGVLAGMFGKRDRSGRRRDPHDGARFRI